MRGYIDALQNAVKILQTKVYTQETQDLNTAGIPKTEIFSPSILIEAASVEGAAASPIAATTLGDSHHKQIESILPKLNFELCKSILETLSLFLISSQWVKLDIDKIKELKTRLGVLVQIDVTNRPELRLLRVFVLEIFNLCLQDQHDYVDLDCAPAMEEFDPGPLHAPTGAPYPKPQHKPSSLHIKNEYFIVCQESAKIQGLEKVYLCALLHFCRTLLSEEKKSFILQESIPIAKSENNVLHFCIKIFYLLTQIPNYLLAAKVLYIWLRDNGFRFRADEMSAVDYNAQILSNPLVKGIIRLHRLGIVEDEICYSLPIQLVRGKNLITIGVPDEIVLDDPDLPTAENVQAVMRDILSGSHTLYYADEKLRVTEPKIEAILYTAQDNLNDAYALILIAYILFANPPTRLQSLCLCIHACSLACQNPEIWQNGEDDFFIHQVFPLLYYFFDKKRGTIGNHDFQQQRRKFLGHPNGPSFAEIIELPPQPFKRTKNLRRVRSDSNSSLPGRARAGSSSSGGSDPGSPVSSPRKFSAGAMASSSPKTESKWKRARRRFSSLFSFSRLPAMEMLQESEHHILAHYFYLFFLNSICPDYILQNKGLPVKVALMKFRDEHSQKIDQELSHLRCLPEDYLLALRTSLPDLPQEHKTQTFVDGNDGYIRLQQKASSRDNSPSPTHMDEKTA